MPLSAILHSSPTVAQRIEYLRTAGWVKSNGEFGAPLPPPAYVRTTPTGPDIFCGIESFSRHTSDEGWQLQIGLRDAGYLLVGRSLDFDATDIEAIINHLSPQTLILQDKREWDPSNDACIAKSEAFTNCEVLKQQDDIFKLTIVKDAHARPGYHCGSAYEIGCHAWIVYYNPEIVCALAPYIRPEHVVRTWHSVDRERVPPFTAGDRQRDACLLSGAVNRDLYPLRARLKDAAAAGRLYRTKFTPHPGYHARGSNTPAYLKMLTGFKVAICTCSIFGYSLRKLIESTACGCRVITDLPPDEVLPGGIDGNLVRVHPDIAVDDLNEIIRSLILEYDADRQRRYAELAVEWYDWRRRGRELAEKIEEMRASYASS